MTHDKPKEFGEGGGGGGGGLSGFLIAPGKGKALKRQQE